MLQSIGAANYKEKANEIHTFEDIKLLHTCITRLSNFYQNKTF